MSRIGKQPIEIPAGVEVKVEGDTVMVKGSKGELKIEAQPVIKVEVKDNQVFVTLKKETKEAPAFWGLTRALIANMVHGVHEGFEKQLQLEGVGYKANMEGENLVVNVGFSHPVKFEKVEGITFKVEKNIITISGIDRQLVGQVAAKIRKTRPPEPYKGKGIRYVGEHVRRKTGKKAATSE